MMGSRCRVDAAQRSRHISATARAAARPDPGLGAGLALGDDFTAENTRALYGEAKLALSERTAATLNLRHDALAVRFAAEPVPGNGNRLVRERRDFDVTSYRLGLSHAWTAASTCASTRRTGR